MENEKLPLGATAERLVRVYPMTYKQKMEFEEISEKLAEMRRAKDGHARRRVRRRYEFSGSRWKAEEEVRAA